MLNPDVLVDAFVAKLRDVPELVEALGGDPGAITGYMDQFAGENSMRAAILGQPPGSMLVCFQGTGKTRVNGAAAWRHAFTVAVRAPEAAEGGVTYGKLWSLFVNGVPRTGNDAGLPLFRFPIHDACYPMDLELPGSQRVQIMVAPDGTTIDVFEFAAGLVEIGDN